jgi:hypothetical protein
MVEIAVFATMQRVTEPSFPIVQPCSTSLEITVASQDSIRTKSTTYTG